VVDRSANRVQGACIDDDIAARCGSAGQRRLRADWQDTLRRRDDRGNLAFVCRKRDAGGESARDMSRIAEKGRDNGRVGVD
jgi:hypothetical protein